MLSLNGLLDTRIVSWLGNKKTERNIDNLETPIEPKEATDIYEFECCVECGICVSSCATKQMRDTFIGAVGLMKIARFEKDSRDVRTTDDDYHIIRSQNGVFSCMTLLGCQDNCPKNLPYIEIIAYLRRKMTKNILCHNV